MDSKKIKINSEWRFHLGEEEAAWYKGYDDTGWKEVTLPHDWSVEYPFSKDYSSGTGYLCGGTAWYRGYFSYEKLDSDKCVKLLFDGVYKHAKVWVNSYYCGNHAYGYTPFEFDITDFLSTDGNNEISVRIDHQDICDSRWFTGSGIYRDVFVYSCEKVHIERDGISFVTEEIKDDKANIKINYEVVNETKEARKVIISPSLVNEDNVYKLKNAELSLLAGEKKKIEITDTIDNPLIWSIEDPNLYKLDTVLDINGVKSHALPIVVGIRSFSFDAKSGFSLNGKNMKLKGVCLHHDAGCLGSAVTKEIWKRRLDTLKEAGCNAIRCSHNPHMNALYDLCDEMGFIVMDEAFDEWENAKNKWSTGHNVYPPRHQGYYEDFVENHERDLRSMVRRDRNHPSVVFYSIGNEIDYPNDPYCHPSFMEMTGNNDNNKPAQERQYDINKPNMERLSTLARHLTSIVKSEEPSAIVTMALAFPELSLNLGVGDSLDVLGFNYKEHLYDETRERMPDKPLIGSENGHSYENWLAVKEKDYVAGQFLWTGIDYLGEAHGWPIHGASAGLITTAGFKKAGFYQTKSYWDDNPTPFIASVKKPDREGWLNYLPVWDYEEGDSVYVKCFAPDIKGAEVILELDGEIVDRVGFNEEEGAFFSEIIYKKGSLKARYIVDEEEVASCSISNDGSFDDFQLKLYEESSETGYIYQIELALKDKDGNTLRSSDKEVLVEAIGPCEFKGIDNGNLECNVDMQSKKKPTYLGESVIYIKRTGAGKIQLKVNIENVEKMLEL